MTNFTDNRNNARVFRTFDECSEFKSTLDNQDRLFARMQYRDATIGDAGGYVIHRTTCLSTGREDFVAA